MELIKEKPKCPHCGQVMKIWIEDMFSFAGGLGWGTPYLFVCFNDGCPLYVDGWGNIRSMYGHRASVRCMCDPSNGKFEGIPVFSPMGMKGGIIDKLPEDKKEPCPDAGNRPWGFYDILIESPGYKVKRITVLPGKRISLQKHFKRSEHWHVVDGSAIVSVDGNSSVISSGDSVDIPCGALHRVGCSHTGVTFIEVQRGEYLGEDDIIRYDDDFGRDI